MKFLVILGAVLAVASAQFQQFRRQPLSPFPARVAQPTPRPQQAYVAVASGDRDAQILRYDNEINPDSSFAYAFQTSNGIDVQAQGTPRNLGGNPPAVPVVIQGSYAYTSSDGLPVSISYIADENGYQPQGDALPTPPPVPPQILRALEYIARNPQKK